MAISMQTLHDALIALTTTVGIAVLLAILMIAVGGLFQHDKNRRHADTPPADPGQHMTSDDHSRQLVLR
jgi:hypothetical protein